MRLSRLDYEFVGSPADPNCVRVDYSVKGFEITVFKGSSEPQKSFYFEPRQNAHKKGMQALRDANKSNRH